MPRGPKRRKATLVLVHLGFALVAVRAHADPSQPNATTGLSTAPAPVPAALHVEYVAPGDCPSEADFEAGVQARTTFARFADEPNAQAVHVVVRSTTAKYAGHLSIVSRSGRVSERDVEDALCSDVVDALALVTALAVDPNATLSMPVPAGPPPTGPVTPSLAASSPEASAVTPTVSPPATRTSPPPEDAHTSSASPPRSAPYAGSGPSRWGVGAGASFVTIAGIAPDALAGGGGFGEIESRSDQWFAPTVRLAVFGAENGAFHTPTAIFVLVAARADVCPLRFGSRDLSIRPCVAADVGALYARGIQTQVTFPQHAVVPWFDAAVLLRARWAPGGWLFFLEAEGGILVPVTRPSFFYREPNSSLSQPPVDDPGNVGVVGSFTVGMRFW
jgi:hypothetical protein